MRRQAHVSLSERTLFHRVILIKLSEPMAKCLQGFSLGRTQGVNLGQMGQYLVFTFLCKLEVQPGFPQTGWYPASLVEIPGVLPSFPTWPRNSPLPHTPATRCVNPSLCPAGSSLLTAPTQPLSPPIPSGIPMPPRLLQPPASFTGGSVSQLPL